MLKKIAFLSTIFILSFYNLNASATETKTEDKTEKYNPVPAIMHHISDAHEWHFWDTEDEEGHKHAASIPLPIILYTDNGLVSFMSSEFKHDDEGKVVVEKNGEKFVKMHGSIYYASEEAHHGSYIEHSEEEGSHAVLNAKPWDFSITKNVVGIFLAMIIIFLIFTRVASSYKKNGGIPTGITGWMEPLVLFVRDDIALPNIGEKK